MMFILGMISGAFVLAMYSCVVLSGRLSREEEQRDKDRKG